MATSSRTLNPLHFEDLEPHRFEDLVRQLVYDFRPWKSLEAIGRTGSDEGIDIRGIEWLNNSPQIIDGEEEDEDQSAIRDTMPEDRVWIIQCKREKSLGPKKVRAIISSFFSSTDQVPYGYILSAACDFSKVARDAFRTELAKYGVQEHYIWGKGEIEDQLFLPKNDYLLFAYFGISLQIKRRSLKTQLSTRLALKRKLVKGLGSINQLGHAPVLIRDPQDEDYPYIHSVDDFIKRPKWRYWQFYSHQPPNHVTFIGVKNFAYVDWETKEYDVLEDHDEGVPYHPEMYGLERNWSDPIQKGEIFRVYFERHVSKQNRAWRIELRKIHYDRILAYDDLGDPYNEAPHLLVDSFNGNLFELKVLLFFESQGERYDATGFRAEEGKRIEYFPKVIPDEREIYYEERKKQGV